MSSGDEIRHVGGKRDPLAGKSLIKEQHAPTLPNVVVILPLASGHLGPDVLGKGLRPHRGRGHERVRAGHCQLSDDKGVPQHCAQAVSQFTLGALPSGIHVQLRPPALSNNDIMERNDVERQGRRVVADPADGSGVGVDSPEVDVQSQYRLSHVGILRTVQLLSTLEVK